MLHLMSHFSALQGEGPDVAEMKMMGHELHVLREERAALRRELEELRAQNSKLQAALRLWSDSTAQANSVLAHPLTAALVRDEMESERLIVDVPLSDNIV